MPAHSGFSGNCRLRTKKQFQRVFKTHHRSADRDFVVLARCNGSVQARLGLAVPKRQVPKAVARNRLKRLIRESFRRAQARLKGMDIVVLAQRGTDGRGGQNVRRSLDGHWRALETAVKRRGDPPVRG